MGITIVAIISIMCFAMAAVCAVGLGVYWIRECMRFIKDDYYSKGVDEERWR